MNDLSVQFERLIKGVEERRREAIGELNKGGHRDMVIGFWDGYRQACDDLLNWAKECAPIKTTCTI